MFRGVVETGGGGERGRGGRPRAKGDGGACCCTRSGEESSGKTEGKSRVSVERKRRCVRSADEELNGG